MFTLTHSILMLCNRLPPLKAPLPLRNPPPRKKKRNPHASTSHFPGFLATKASLFRGTSTGRLAPRQRRTLGRLQKSAPPPPTPTQTEWSEHRTRNTAPWFESRSGHWLDFQLFSVVPEFKSSATLGNSQLVPPASWDF